MKLFFTLIVGFFLSAFSGTAAEYKQDFNKPTVSEMKNNNKTKVEAGVLKINNWGNAAFDFRSETPVEITFRARVAKVFNSKNSPCWIFYLYGSENAYGMFRWRKDNILESYFYKNNQRKGGAIKPFQFIENQWFSVKILLMKKLVSVKIDNVEIMNSPHIGFLPMTKISFGAYNVDWELDDLEIKEIPAEKQTLIEKPLFSADFNDSLDAFNEKNEKVSLLKAEHYQLTQGIDGKGLTVKNGKNAGVSYSIKQPFHSKTGGLMFWIRTNQKAGCMIFKLTDGVSDKLSAGLGGNKRIHITIPRTDTKKGLEYIRSIPGELGDWVLVALTWNEESDATFFINTFPYSVCFMPGQRTPLFLNADLNGISRLEFLSNSKYDYTIDRVRFFQRTLKNSDVYAEYRRFMPFDMVMERTIVPANIPAEISVQLAPGGFYTRPKPVENTPQIKGNGVFRFCLKDKNGAILLDETKSAAVNGPMDIILKPTTLAPGKYTLECTVNNAYQRTFVIDSFSSDYKANPMKTGLKTGKLLYSKKLNNAEDPAILKQGKIQVPPGKTYLEAGLDKTDRFSFEIPFPLEQLGKPVALDITWPDDKTRMMGWYLYPSKIGTNRDRLQTGVSSGNEFPCSGKMQTTRHIFYPGSDAYLFEARTLAAGMPAAVAEIKIYEIEDGLPTLAIQSPENMEGRKFGFYDEDQSFTNNLNADVMNRHSPVFSKFSAKNPNESAFFTDEIMRYFNYTGMNTLHAPLWRYTNTYFPLEGQTSEYLMYPGRPGSLGYVFDTFAKHRKKFIAIMNYTNLPDLNKLDKIESDYKKEGLETLDRYGDSIVRYLAGNHRANICHPKVLELFATYFEEPVKRYGKISGFGGIEYWLNNFGNWGSLDYGYDDYTVRKFSRETGISVPEKMDARYHYLTTEKRNEWLKWRSEQVTNVVKMFRSVLDRCNPNLKLFIGVNQDQKNYENFGIDLNEIRKIPNVEISIVRHPTGYRHNFHWGKAESTKNEELYNAHDEDIQNYLKNGTAGCVISYNHYFETYVKPLNSKYQCYFENADIKPHGRFYLREPAFVIGAFDALEYVSGGQPLGTIGRDEETREFAQAYCALPAKPFKKISGIDDPVTARFLDTENGTYFYVVNLFHDPVSVQFEFTPDNSYLDLSSGKILKENKLELKPFQLRSFLFPKKKVAIAHLKLIGTNQESVAFYQKRIASLKAALEILLKGRIDVSSERKEISRLENLLNKKQFAELYRLAFSKQMNQLLKKQENVANLIRQQRMMDEGEYAVNCGSMNFYEAPNGLFFFPDQKFDGKYGYFGEYNSVSRDIQGIVGTEIPEIYKTEAYSLQGYRFKVPNGTYKVILYMKPGFQPNFTQGMYRFSVLANNKPVLDRIDLFQHMGGNFKKALRLETDGITVTDGFLTLTWRHEPAKHAKNTNTTVCLANAIQIIKQKNKVNQRSSDQ